MLENTEIKEYLEKLLSTWNQEKADAFHSNCTRDETEGKYIWTYNKNAFSKHRGVTIHRDVTAIHINLTGTVYKLTKQWQFTEHDWPAFLQLYKLSQNSKDFRTEIPIENEITDDAFFFSVVQRPCHQVGLDFQYDIFEGNLIKDFLRIYNLSAEIEKIGEMLSKTNLVIEAAKVRENILRDVVNVESLYIK